MASIMQLLLALEILFDSIYFS